MGLERCYFEDFRFERKVSNPYHQHLEQYSDFVLRDLEGEAFKGKWKSEVFAREAPLFVEIGSGFGDFMLDYCEAHPEIQFVGMDYRFKRSFHLAKKLAEKDSSNFRYLRSRGERLSFLFGESEVDGLFYFFPDPWPKKRHHKKRLFNPFFLQQVVKVLRPGGQFLIKTDHPDYFQWMKDILHNGDFPLQVLLETEDLYRDFPQHFLTEHQTKFEKIFLQQKVSIKSLVLQCNK